MTLQVLLVEDKPDDAELILYELKHAGFEPQWRRVESETDYVRALAEQPPDIILADFTLPQFNGLDALRLLIERELDIPFILVTGSLGEELAVESIKRGAADYLLKDRLVRLGEAVRRALTAHDLRRQKNEAVLALRESEERYRRLAENALDIIYRVRLRPEYEVEFINQAVLTITGYAPDEFYENSELFSHLISSADENGTTPARELIKLLGHESVVRVTRRDGDQIWLEQHLVPLYDEAGQVIAVEGIARDVTARKQAEESVRTYASELEARVAERTAELNRAKERVEVILNSSSDVIVLTNLTGIIQQVNPVFADVFGWSGEDAFGQPLVRFATTESVEVLRNALAQTAYSGHASRAEAMLMSRIGMPFHADIVVSPIETSQNQTTGLVCSIRDITDRKRLESSLRQTLAQEVQLNELKSRFVSIVSHEFRTPLAVIQTATDLVERYSDRLTEADKKEEFSRIRFSIKTMVELLEDVLMISRVDAGKLQFSPGPVDLAAFCDSLLREFRRTLSAKHQLVASYTGLAGDVNVDTKLLRHILSNLLSNAIKYSPSGGEVRLSAVREEDRIILRVQDQGIGIPQVDQVRLFEIFHRGSNVGSISGTGLGLTIVKQFVDLHNGTITLESGEDQGTTFIITLPVIPDSDVPPVSDLAE
ncbi:MAG TPA: PAS domain S-box protein [Aggregatilinea sp.]|uniref:PAS domain S-box protein n=1 Tax=Aggregatilinea sp. TaxID=2806333 RepID=UPI002CBBD5DC|nr:PAS domain S-box protein [Aggregatilinea sp.]HML21118.1 PAS domain S-box protein [Aggregatilinea sp.]